MVISHKSHATADHTRQQNGTSVCCMWVIAVHCIYVCLYSGLLRFLLQHIVGHPLHCVLQKITHAVAHLLHSNLLPCALAAVQAVHIEPVERPNDCCITTGIEGARAEVMCITVIAVVKCLKLPSMLVVEDHLQSVGSE